MSEEGIVTICGFVFLFAMGCIGLYALNRAEESKNELIRLLKDYLEKE